MKLIFEAILAIIKIWVSRDAEIKEKRKELSSDLSDAIKNNDRERIDHILSKLRK